MMNIAFYICIQNHEVLLYPMCNKRNYIYLKLEFFFEDIKQNKKDQ
jgi:hypothetical protein